MSRVAKSRLVRLALVFLVALVVRGVAGARTALIARDGVAYLEVADRLAKGDVNGALAHHYPPGYPAVVATVARLRRSPADEVSGLAASAVAGAIAAVLVVLALAQAGELSPELELGAGLLAGLHPGSVELGATVVADALFATLVLAACGAALAALAGRRLLWPLAGTLAGASYLARPEGIVVLLALVPVALASRARPGGRRAPGSALLLLAPAIVVAVPYVVAIRPHRSMTGREENAWKLTKKRELFLEAGGERVFPRGADGERHLDVAGAGGVAKDATVRAAKQVGWLLHPLEGANPIVLALVVAAFARRRERAVALARVLAPVALALLGTYALVRTDPRYARIIAHLFLPVAALGLEPLVLAASNGARGARAKVALALVLVAPVGPALRARDASKRSWRDAGLACRGLARIASVDPRVAFYAGASHVDLFLPLRDAGPEPAARAHAIVAAAREADAIVLGPRERELVPLVLRAGPALAIGVPEHERPDREQLVIIRR